MTKTALVDELISANDMVLTVNFNCQPKPEAIAQMFAEAGKPKDENFANVLANECLIGKETTLVCHVIKSEDNLGRSLVKETAS